MAGPTVVKYLDRAQEHLPSIKVAADVVASQLQALLG